MLTHVNDGVLIYKDNKSSSAASEPNECCKVQTIFHNKQIRELLEAPTIPLSSDDQRSVMGDLSMAYTPSKVLIEDDFTEPHNFLFERSVI